MGKWSDTLAHVLLGLALVVLYGSCLSSVQAQAGNEEDERQTYEQLEDQLDDDDERTRAIAATKLGETVDHRDDAGSRLIRATRSDQSWKVRASAVRSLARLGYREALPDLAAALRDPSPEVRLVAAAAFWRMPTPAVTPALLKLLEDSDHDVRQWSLAAIASSKDRRGLQSIKRLAQTDPEPDVSIAALRALSSWGPAAEPKAVMVRVANSRKQNLPVRIAAFEGWLRLDADGAQAGLREALKKARRNNVRRALRRLIKSSSNDTKK